MWSSEHDCIANEIRAAADRAALDRIEHELNYGYRWLAAGERRHLLALVRAAADALAL